MITMFWILAIFFSIIGIRLTAKFFVDSMSYGTAAIWILSILIGAFSIGVINAGSWHNVIAFFTG